MKRQRAYPSIFLLFIMITLLVIGGIAKANSIEEGTTYKASTVVLITFDGHEDQFFGEKLKKDGFLMYAGDREGLEDGGELGYVYENETFKGVFTLDGAKRFIIKSEDGEPFGLISMNVVDRYFMANNIVIEAYEGDKLLGVQEVEIGHDLSEAVQLNPIFHEVTEIRIGSLEGYGVWNYFDNFQILKYVEEDAQ